MGFDCRFGSGLELANLVVSSGLLNQSWDSILKLYRELKLNPSEEIRFGTYQQSNCTVIAFVTSPTLTKHHLQEEDELVSSSFLPPFHFLCTKSNPTFSIHKAAVTLFSSLIDQLTNLKNQVFLCLSLENLMSFYNNFYISQMGLNPN